MHNTARTALSASYFDGSSGKAHAVLLQQSGDVLLVFDAAPSPVTLTAVSAESAVKRSVPLNEVQWPERTRHGRRVAHFKSGGSVQCNDNAAWDSWCKSSGHRDSVVVNMQQSWRWALGSVAVLVVAAVGFYAWGLPVAARAVVGVTPLRVDVVLGEASLSTIDTHLMAPSAMPLAEQNRLRAALTQTLSAMPAGSVPAWQLVFRKSLIGPNAFALPGGTLIMTDELVTLVGADAQVLTTVLAHEIGHISHRHGLRLVVQAAMLSGVSSVVLGDFSTLLVGVPVLLGQSSYSRDAEREADAEAVRILKAARISPAVMVTLFEKLEQFRLDITRSPTSTASKNTTNPDKNDTTASEKEPSSALGIAFASHPADAERIAFFKNAAQLQLDSPP